MANLIPRDDAPPAAAPLRSRTLAGDEPLRRAVLRTLRILFPEAGQVRPRVAILGDCEAAYAGELASAGFDVLVNPGDLERDGPFDATVCCGVLECLDAPAAFLQAMGRTTRRALLLETHYATEPQRGRWNLSGVTRHEGNRGRWLEAGGARAFWIERTHLLEGMRAAGFDAVYEQYDRLTDMVEDDAIARHSRSLFVGVKVPSARP